MRKGLETLWEEYEGRLLLTNIANQILAGVVDRSSVTPFLQKMKRSGSGVPTRADALSAEPDQIGSYQPERMYFITQDSGDISSDMLLLRVVPMLSILDNISLATEDPNAPNGLRARAQRELRMMRNPAVKGLQYQDAEEKFRKILFSTASTSNVPLAPSLPESIRRIPMAKGNIEGTRVKLNGRAPTPTFFSPMQLEGKEFTGIFTEGLKKDAVADFFRDQLGLDHLSQYYNSERVILGWYIIRLSQISDAFAKRPSPFDDTSSARFRGCYGLHLGVRGSMGRTANLAQIGHGLDIIGEREIVCPNNYPKPNEREVIFGYLGALEIPRNDGYLYKFDGSDRDRTFFDVCVGRNEKSEVINTILGACDV